MKIQIAGAVLIVLAAVAGCSSSSGAGGSSGASSSQKFVKSETQDASATARDVTSIVAEAAKVDETDTSAMTQLAADAQTLHGHLDGFRQALLLAASASNNTQLNFVQAENDLKSAAGSLDVWTGNPNPSASAKWQREMGTGIGEWNQAATKLWAAAAAGAPPMITVAS